jgi:hypothetical protein
MLCKSEDEQCVNTQEIDNDECLHEEWIEYVWEWSAASKHWFKERERDREGGDNIGMYVGDIYMYDIVVSSVIDGCFSYNDRQHWLSVVVKVKKRNRKKE